ncbi:MAG: hypothetical protein AAFR54_03915 [Planctomycetota bacterium]
MDRTMPAGGALRALRRPRTLALLAALALAGPLAAGAAQDALEGAGAAPAVSDADPFAAPPPPAADGVRMLRFPDGSVRFAAIVGHDPDGLDIVRVDTSGRARLTWDLLDQEQASDLRAQFGYVDVEAEEVFVQGERLLFEGGGSMTGVIVSREGDHFLVKTSGNLQKIPKVRVRSIESRVQMPALDVFSRDEIYAKLLSEADLDTATGRVALAEKCEGILDFVHAAEHYAAAVELGIERGDAARVEGALVRAEAKAEAQGQLEVLRTADQERRRGNFDAAIAIARAFPEQFAGSPLVEDAFKTEKRLEEARDKAATELVRKRWNFWARRLTRAKAATDDTFDQLQSWAVEALPGEIETKVMEDLVKGVSAAYQPDDVRALWDARDRRRWTSATYGTSGTWLLGLEAAQAGIEAEDERAAPVSAADAQRQAIEERIRRYAQNQRAAQRGGAGAAQAEARQEFWSSWSVAGRAQWLLAYYAENGGDYELRPKPFLRPCTRCAGEGAISVVASGTVSRQELSAVAACPLCRGVQVVRRINFR